MRQTDSRTRLTGLLRELFQLDVADLDFGLYRLFRLKRDEIESFLTKQLPAEVKQAFDAAAGSEREALRMRVDDLAERVRAMVADDAILPSGEPNPVHAETKAVKDYVEARSGLRAVEVSEAQQAEVFNLLYAFLSRYYDDGDFIARRCYGARASYAVPYNGEEVFFHWANKGQYYVKSGEAFRDYAFAVGTLGGEYRVRFMLVEATAPKNNTKGDTRFFFPLPKQVTFDQPTRMLTVPFMYRLPTEAEVTRYGKNVKGQDLLLEEATPEILLAIPDEVLRATLAAASPTGSNTGDDDPPTLLRQRLRHFTRKNTTDYFVFKDLGAFLQQELDFFVRDQVVHEADLEGDFDAKRRTIRVFRKLAETLITFLSQIENAQKLLFEKKKFVLRTDYLVPVQHVPRVLWPDVLANKAQMAEWKTLYGLEPQSNLFNLKGRVTEQVLQQHPTLVLNTQNFEADFTTRLLEAMGDLDEETDGLLVHGENFQALNLLQARYREGVKCTYIDPPYNSKTTAILYKNTYKHSSWLSLMDNRLALSRRLSTNDGSHVVAIDENEQELLGRLLSMHFPDFEKVCVTVVHNKKGTQGDYFSYNHEFAYFCIPPALPEVNGRAVPEAEWDYDNLRKWGRESERRTARNCFYPVFVEAGEIVGFGDVCDETFHPGQANVAFDKLHKRIAVYPVDSKGVERKWRYARQPVEGILTLLKVHVTASGEVQIVKAKANKVFKTVWDDPKYIAGDYGTRWLSDLGLKVKENLYPKSIHTVEDSIYALSDSDSTILDYFAGSGTTGHAVINLNRDDGGERKFILVEMGDYFDSVLVPRIQKVMFAPDWENGKPKRLPTMEEAKRTPRLVKVLRLESYEDTLHNTFSDKAVERLAERENAHRELVGEEEYRIRYLTKLPLEASDSMLNLVKLEHPFDYTLEVLTDHGPKTELVDLLETFNWLYGLRVHRLLKWVHRRDKAGKERDGRSYRVVVASDCDGKKRILVVWREMTGLDPKMERTFLEAKAKETGTFEECWINGDTAAKGFASLDGLFKRLMEEGGR